MILVKWRCISLFTCLTKAEKPAPTFFKHSFNNTKSRDFDVSDKNPGTLRNGWPLGDFFDRGYGFLCGLPARFWWGHNETSFLNSIHKLFYPKGQSFPQSFRMGCALYLRVGEPCVAWTIWRPTMTLITRVLPSWAIRRWVKATLWTAAQDERFAFGHLGAVGLCRSSALASEIG